MTERFPSVHTAIAVLEPHDFRNCSADTEQLFPPEATDDYIFQRRWLYGFYLRYFDLHSLQQNIRKLRSERPPEKETDEWGDVPGLFNAPVLDWVSPKCHTLMQSAAG